MAAVAQTGKRERFTLDDRQYGWIVHAALFTATLIMFTGAAVRLTGSGLGCSSWPTCEAGQLLPALGTHEMIEFGNRLVTAVVGIPCLLAAIGAFRLRPFRRELVGPALLLPLGVLTQAIMGGITVMLDLSWEVVIAHYLLSCVLLVACVVLVWRFHRPGIPAPVNERLTVIGTRIVVVLGFVIIVAGTFATAAGPHAGGDGTGDVIERLTVSGGDGLGTIIRIHGHAAAIWGGLAVILWIFARVRGAGSTLMRPLTWVCVLIAAQGILGLIQYYNELPPEVVWAHTSLAAVLWITLVWAVLAAGRSRSAGG